LAPFGRKGSYSYRFEKEGKWSALLDDVESQIFLQNVLNVLPLTRIKFAFEWKWFPAPTSVKDLLFFKVEKEEKGEVENS